MKKLLQYGLTALFGLLIVILILLGKGTFQQTDLQTIYRDLCDAFTIPGVIMMCFGALVLISKGGAFDILKYGIIKLFDLFKRDLTKVKYRTLYDYKKAQEGKKASIAFLLIVGVGLTAVAVVFLILYNSVTPVQ